MARTPCKLCPICSQRNMLLGIAIEDIEQNCKLDDENKPICYGCYLDSLIPDGYEKDEKYYPIPNCPPIAARHPKTGIPILDDRQMTVREIMERR